EADIFVANIAHNSNWDVFVNPTGLDWLIQNFKHPLAGSASRLHQLVELMQSADWIVKERSQHEKGDQIAKLHRAGEHSATAKREHDHSAQRFEHRHRR